MTQGDLVLAALARREATYWAKLEEAVAACGSGEELLLALVYAHGRWVVEEGRHGCMFLKALPENGAHDPRVAEAAAGHERRLLTFRRELALASG